MIMSLSVFKEVHNTWPAKNGKPAGESYDLLCMDNSNPPEHRMEEMLYYRTKEEERAKVWGKSVGTTIQVGVSKIRHGDNGGKATLIGSIVRSQKVRVNDYGFKKSSDRQRLARTNSPFRGRHRFWYLTGSNPVGPFCNPDLRGHSAQTTNCVWSCVSLVAGIGQKMRSSL